MHRLKWPPRLRRRNLPLAPRIQPIPCTRHSLCIPPTPLTQLSLPTQRLHYQENSVRRNPARFRQHLSDSINEELAQVNTWLPLFQPNCEAPWDLDAPNCDSFAVRQFHEIDASTSYKMGIHRSRTSAEYQGQGTWLLTIYPEENSKPLIRYWLFESGDLPPVKAD